MPVRPQAGHRTTKTRWPSSNAGAMTVVVPHLTHGGGGGWNSSGMMSGSLASGGSAIGLSGTGACRRS